MDPPIPSNFNVGIAIGGGDCFYDSFAQCLNEQQRQKRKISAKSLRLKCKKYAEQVLLNDESWLRKSLEHEKQSLDDYIRSIEYCANDRKIPPIWGRPEIEGRMICDYFNVKLHVIEKHRIENEEICVDEVVDRNGSRSVNNIDYCAKDIAHIINKGFDHFEPVLRMKDDISNLIHVGGGHHNNANKNRNTPNVGSKVAKQKHSEPIEKYLAKGKTSGRRIAPTMGNTIPEQRSIVQSCERYCGVGDVRGKQIWLNQIVDKSGSKCVESVDYENDDTMHIVNKGDLHFEPILKNKAETLIKSSLIQETLECKDSTSDSSSDSDSDEQTSSITPDDSMDDSKTKFGVELVNVICSDDGEKLKLESVRSCLEQGADINFKDANRNNNTALHSAVLKNLQMVLKFLLARGADKSIKNCHNETPLDLATKHKKKSCIKILDTAKLPNKTKSDVANICDTLEGLPQSQTDVPKPVHLKRAEIDNIIRIGLQENQSFEKVNNTINKLNTDLLTELEIDCLNEQYVKLCSEFWLEYVDKVKVTLTENSHISTISEIGNVIDTIKNLHKIPEAFHDSFYKLLIEHKTFPSSYDETHIVRLFKERCKNKVQNISKKPKQFSDDEIEDIIEKDVSERKSNLDAIKSLIIQKADKEIKKPEEHKIEQMYIKIVLKLFLQEANNVKLQNVNVIHERISRVNCIRKLNEMFNPFNELDSYKRLMEHSKLIYDEDKADILKKFKFDFINNVISYADDIKREFSFLDEFSNFLNSIKDTQMIITKLKLHQFCSGGIGLEELLHKVNGLGNIFNGENLKPLQEAINKIDNKNIHLLDNLKQNINNYIKPVDVQTKTLDGRSVIEVIGNNITLSNTTPAVEEQLLKHPEVQEVRFVAAAIVHNDKDIDNPDIWHGKNIVVVSKVFKIYDNVIWNVSGKDSDCIYRSRANDGEGVAGQGQHGKDGQAGESGGNVYIRADEIVNGEKFNIISVGGKGGNGQDGGNGNNGENGYSIEPQEFITNFPPPANCKTSVRPSFLQKNICNIIADMAEIKTAWYKGCKPKKPEEIVKDLARFRGNDIHTDTFMQVITTKGNEITFSFMRGSGIFTKSHQSYLLYKGSLGKAGGAGGEWGLGGEGGYAGEIKVLVPGRTPLETVKRGENGRNGVGGLYGQHGKNGWDMGYVDLKRKRNTFLKSPISKKHKWPEYFGTIGNMKLQLNYHDTKYGLRVTCSDRRNRGCSLRFAEITNLAEPVKTQSVYQERMAYRTPTRQGESKSSRKKAISCDAIDNSYSQTVQREYTLQHSLDEIKNIALQQIAELERDETETTAEITIERRVNSNVHRYKHYKKSAPTVMPKMIDIPLCQYSDVRHKLKRNSLLSKDWNNDWSLIKNIELNTAQLSKLFTYFQDQKADDGIDNLTEDDAGKTEQDVLYIEQILKAKYQLATLTEITKEVQQYLVLSYSIQDSGDAANYLTESKNQTSSCKTTHKALGTLDKYIKEEEKQQGNHVCNLYDFCNTLVDNFFEEVKKTSEYLDANNSTVKNSQNIESISFEEVIQHPEYVALAHTLRFCLSQRILDNSQTDIKKYTDKYNDIIQKEDHGLIIFPQSFTKLNFEIYSNKSVAEVLLNDIRRGPNSSAYREILARIFDVNIRVYIRNQDNTLNVINDHNPSAETKICYSLSTSKFDQLVLNENYLRLIKERKQHCALYKRIVEDIYMLQRKEDCDDYLKMKSYLFVTNISYEQLPSYILRDNFADIIHQISLYYPKSFIKKINARLGMLQISCHISGVTAILGSILKRFECEGRHASAHEIFYLVDCILTSITANRDELDIYYWIVSAHHQQNWIVELILLDLENYFKTQLNEKDNWRKYLLNIESRYILLLFKKKLDDQLQIDPIPIHCVDDILLFLSKSSSEIADLSNLPLTAWIVPLKESYFRYLLSKFETLNNSTQLHEACYYLLSIENLYGKFLTNKLIENLEEKKSEFSRSRLDILEILRKFHDEIWYLTDDVLNFISNHGFERWKGIKNKFSRENYVRNINELTTLMKDNCNSSLGILDKLSEHNAAVIEIKDAYQSLLHKYPYGVSKLTAYQLECAACNETIAIAQIMRVIYFNRNFMLRDTQILAIVILLKNASNTLLQVSTGEGKSLIAVAVAIVKALQGKKSDIITSSSVLAKRDAEDNRDIYKIFGISVSHNCSKEIEKRKQVYSSNDVVYGDIASFQRDYLLDKFYEKNILGDRNFENVIIDEVDSMLLDNGNNVLYLSHDVAGLDKLERIYIFIWQWINTPALSHSDISHILNADKIKNAILDNLKCTIKKEDIKMIDSRLGSQEINNIWESLIEHRVLDSYGNIQVIQSEIEDIVKLVWSWNETSIYNRICYLIKQRLERKKHLQVPNYLKQFVEQHLSAWIDNAIRALFMKEGRDYVLDVDRTGTSSDLNPNITIIDRDTGTDQANSQWDEALHQFLQLKHGCKLSMQSLKAVFISNVSYFRLYQRLSGFTGTLGSQAERDLLKELHKVDFVTIPTAKQRTFHEEKPCICEDRRHWVKNIVAECTQIVNAKRSCLIICDTISEVDTLYPELRVIYGDNVHAYKRDYEQLTIANREEGLQASQIIIATNLAGRGTDIRLADDLKLSGGLHVCLTYLPNNTRIEQQAFGRSARCGDKGSGRLIVIEPDCKQLGFSHMIALKTERDNIESHRVAQTKQYYYQHIATEEQLFNSFTARYEHLRREVNQLNPEHKELKEIALNSCLDRWAFWLDTNSDFIKEANDVKTFVNSSLRKFLSKLDVLRSEDLTCWITMDHDKVQNQILISRAIQMGKWFTSHGKHQQAINLFDQVIEQEPYFSEAAHYYKAFSIIKLGQPIKSFKRELIRAAKLFDDHKTFSMHAAALIDFFKQSLSTSIFKIDAYKEQKEKEHNLLQMFLQSIENILGPTITPQSFMNNDIDENLAEVVYQDLLKSGILKKAKINFSKADNDFKYCCCDYGIQIDQFETFLKDHDRQEFDEKSFEKELVKDFVLPSQEALWDLLIRKKVFCHEQKYIAIKKGKLQQTRNVKQVFDIHESKYEYDTYALLHAEFAEEGNIVYEEHAFKKHFGENVYNILIDRNEVHIVRKAHVPSTDFQSVELPSYDSITLDDFKKTNIKDNEAKIILQDLVNQGILQKQPNSEEYRLKMQFGYIKLPNHPMYENETRELMSKCFAFRIALQKMEQIVKKGLRFIELPLMSNPHQDLIWELVSQNIIAPVYVSSEPMNFEKKLKDLYGINLTEDEIHHMLPITVERSFINHLVEKGWLSKHLFLKTYKIKNSEIKNEFSFAINPLDVIRQAFDYRLQLSNEATIKSILNTLQTLSSKFNDSTKCDVFLKPISECFIPGQSLPAKEMHVFTLNGLNDLLMPLTGQNALTMFGSAIWTTAIGTCQIVTSVAIQLLTFSAITKVSNKFMSEGMFDIRFAASALKSAHFDWKDYSKQKLQRLVKTGTANFNTVADLQTATLSDEDFVKSDFGPTVIDIVRHVIPATASSIKQVNLGAIIESHLQGFCEGIMAKALSKLEKHTDIPSFLSCLHTAHTVFQNSAMDMIEKLIKQSLHQKRFEDKWLDVSQEITRPITREFTEITRKLLNTGNNSLTTLNDILRSLELKYSSIAFDSIETVIRKFINDLTAQINHDFPCKTYVKQDADCEKCTNVFHLLKSWLREKTQKYIIDPILDENINPLTKVIRKEMAKILESHRLVNDLTYFTELKDRFYNAPHTSNEDSLDPIVELDVYFTNRCHENVRKLRSMNNNDPNLLAAMIEDNVAMDLECLESFVKEISCMTNQTGIPSVGFTVIVDGEGIERKKFSTVAKGTKTKILYLELDKINYGFIDKSNNIKNYDSIIKFLSLHVYSSKHSTEQKIKSDIITFLKQRTSGQSQSRKKCIEECYLNEDAEYQSPYEHALWTYNPSTDVDLRNAYPLSHEESVISQLSKAYNIALCKINEKLEELDSNSSTIQLEFCEFTATKYGVVQFPNNIANPNKQIEANYPIEFKAERKVRISGVKNEVSYHMTIDCNINPSFPAIGLPYGPHVRYRVGRVGRMGPDGVTGFVLLNENDGMFCMRNGEKMQKKYTFKPSNIFCKRLDRKFSKSLTELHFKLPPQPKDLKAEPKYFSASIETCKKGSKALTSVPIASDYWNYNWKQGKNKLK